MTYSPRRMAKSKNTKFKIFNFYASEKLNRRGEFTQASAVKEAKKRVV